MTHEAVHSRGRILEAHGAAGRVVDELLLYTEKLTPPQTPPVLPLSDEPHLETWTAYEREARLNGTMAALKAHLLQLRFPVRAGISDEADYRAATRRGRRAAITDGHGLHLQDPAAVRLEIRETIAGRIPVLIARERDDFVSLVQALTERNEPVAVPAAIGACIVNGLNNWDRIERYRERWMAQYPGAGESGWFEEFPRFAKQKSLYQDRLIILSSGPYSGLSPAEAGVADGEWHEQSLAIRLAHECTHYFILRVFGCMRSHLHDELVADFVGLIQGLGSYPEELARRVIGLRREGPLAGGRIEEYCGMLSAEARTVLRALAMTVIANLAALARALGRLQDQGPLLANVTYALSLLALEDLASAELIERIRAELP